LLLSKPDILAYLREGKLRFDPSIGEDRVAQVSVDLKLGNKFTTFKQPPHYLPCIHVDPSLWDSADLWEHRQSDTFRLEPAGSSSLKRSNPSTSRLISQGSSKEEAVGLASA
jgi:deoxycytidine triphosphate deaminase